MNASNKTAEFDDTFGERGKQLIYTPGNFYNFLPGLYPSADGTILIYGKYLREAFTPGFSGIGRLLKNGETDTTFGDTLDGFTHVPEASSPLWATDIAKTTRFLFLVTPTGDKVMLSRFDLNGKSPALFTIDTMGSSPSILGLADDKLLVTGTSQEGGVLHRRLPDGSNDSTFGTDGQQLFLEGRFVESWCATSNKERSLIYVSGMADNKGFITCMTPDGKVRSEFADEGTYRVETPNGSGNRCRKVVVTDDGGVLGLISVDGMEPSFLIKLTPEGVIDENFNDGNPLSLAGTVGEDLALQTNGLILVAHFSAPICGISRYLENGSSDTGFGQNGHLEFEKDVLSSIKRLAIDPDGKLLVGGTEGSITAILRLLIG
jgi:uncharacterized delta-60 repeat protein